MVVLLHLFIRTVWGNIFMECFVKYYHFNVAWNWGCSPMCSMNSIKNRADGLFMTIYSYTVTFEKHSYSYYGGILLLKSRVSPFYLEKVFIYYILPLYIIISLPMIRSIRHVWHKPWFSWWNVNFLTEKRFVNQNYLALSN